MTNGTIFNSPSSTSHIYVYTPAYGVYISQQIRYARTSSAYYHDQFLSQGKLLTNKLLLQEFQ